MFLHPKFFHVVEREGMNRVFVRGDQFAWFYIKFPSWVPQGIIIGSKACETVNNSESDTCLWFSLFLASTESTECVLFRGFFMENLKFGRLCG